MRVMLLYLFLLLTAGTSFAAGPGSVLGVWKTEGEKSHVEISRCGDTLCGRIVWLKEPLYTKDADGPVGKPKTDRNNPNPAKQSLPIVGLKIMDGFVPDGEARWEKGTIYDPENGRTYRCKMKLVSPDRLEVRGFIGISLVGRTTTWVR